METTAFDSAITALCPNLFRRLSGIPVEIKHKVTEIRLRVERPVCLYANQELWFLLESGMVSANPRPDLYRAMPEDISESVRTMCEYSLHSNQENLCQGFLTVRGGHRAGICGRASVTEGKVLDLQYISSINLRVAREVKHAADEIVRYFLRRPLENTLIVGPPSSGKTTILRDLARQLSDRSLDISYKVALLDERGEISASFQGAPQTDIGICTDVFDFYPKALGASIAIRTMSPQVILCDEIGDEQDAATLQGCLNAGVVLIATAHASSLEELRRRKHINRMLDSGGFRYLVLLNSIPGSIKEIADVAQMDRVYLDRCDNDRSGDFSLRPVQPASR